MRRCPGNSHSADGKNVVFECRWESARGVDNSARMTRDAGCDFTTFHYNMTGFSFRLSHDSATARLSFGRRPYGHVPGDLFTVVFHGLIIMHARLLRRAIKTWSTNSGTRAVRVGTRLL